MKKILIKTLIVSVMVLLLPFVITMLISKSNDMASIETMDFKIYYEANGSKDELSFNDYILGVVAANMPAGYQMEALKTQAVIARTYALYNVALLCKDDPDKTNFTTSELGLSYISLDSLEQYWGIADYNTYFAKLENAVYGTKDEVIVYNNDLILPVFFDTGAGFTRNSSEAWDIDIPYLVSVDSKQDVTSTNYLKIDEYKVEALITLLNQYYTDLDLTEDNFFTEVSVSSRDSAGYVLKIDLGSQTVSGEEFAKVIGLSSNHFYIEEYEGKARIICNGAGHGVGLSQYGANTMAEEGSDYTEILTYYYTGVSISNISEED
ncbi:MAG: stage II sporulation protein D [Herbinix sp.]|nr:stage II sporulation protein D [Herbinix sp.]